MCYVREQARRTRLSHQNALYAHRARLQPHYYDCHVVEIDALPCGEMSWLYVIGCLSLLYATWQPQQREALYVCVIGLPHCLIASLVSNVHVAIGRLVQALPVPQTSLQPCGHHGYAE
jgi:hypothetical protein